MKKVMIIDDEPDVLEILKEFLEFLDYQTVTFRDPNIAISSFKAGIYDLIITDINLPEINGFALIKKIREIDQTIPIIVITGYIENFAKENIFSKGANAYIEKPFNFNQLKSTIEKTLSGENNWNLQKRLRS